MEEKNIKILLVDDEPDILEILQYNLSAEGFRVITAENGPDALKLVEKEHPQLIILDVMMPDMDGMETCQRIRNLPDQKATIITFLSARSEDFSQMAGFDAGADDYITKPVKPKVLVKKVRALLRRSFEEEQVSGKLLKIGDLEIDREEYRVTVDQNDYFLPKKEFELLLLLASRPGKIFRRKEILDSIWGNETSVGGRTVDVHIRKLRKKFGDQHLKTIKGVGYKLME